MVNERQRMVAEALWKTLTLAFTEPGDRSGRPVAIPVEDTVSALLTCVAQVLVDVDDAKERQRIIAAASPLLYRAVQAGRSRADLILPADHGIVLAH